MANSKRENSNVVISASAIVLDIEGTTTSISFVKDVLFPHVRSHLKDYVEKKWDSAEFQEITKALRLQANEDKEKEVEGVVLIPESEEKETVIKAVVDNVLWQMDNDRKTKALKDLQGLIMEEGYNKGELKGHIYDDVASNIKSWAEQDKAIYIYSSGSVQAQKLLFGHSVKGDLLPFIKGHFDTTVGMKGEVKSYKNILEKISCDPSEVVFLTDVPKEAAAAKDAGIYAILVSREGNAPLNEENEADFPVITSFSEVEFENCVKRRKLSDVSDENKDVKICEVSKDENPDNPKPTTNGGVEMMEVEESSEKELAVVGKNENVKSNVILEKKEVELETEKAEEIKLNVSESIVEHKVDSENIKEKTLTKEIQPDKVEGSVEKVEKSDTKVEPIEEVMALDDQSENCSDKQQETHVKSEQSGSVCNDANKGTEKIGDVTSKVIPETNNSKENQGSSDIKIKSDDTKTEMALVGTDTNSSNESKIQDGSAMKMETKPDSTDASEENGNPNENQEGTQESTVTSDTMDHPVEKQEDTQLMRSSDNEPVSTEEPMRTQTSETGNPNKKQEDTQESTVTSDTMDHPVKKQEDTQLMRSSDNVPVSTEEPMRTQTSEAGNPNKKQEDTQESTVTSDPMDHPVKKQEDTQLMQSSDNEPVSTEEPVRTQTSEAEAIKVDEVSKDKVNQESCVEFERINTPNESQTESKQTDVSTDIDSTTTEKMETPTESQVPTEQKLVPELSEQKPVETKGEEVPKTDEKTKDETHETETINTSQNTEMNESVKETCVDIDNKKINVPSDDKTEMTDGKTTKSHDGEEKTVNNVTEVAQNGISNGHCIEKVNGTSSPSHNGELSPENQDQAIETKKCVDSSENTPTEAMVEA